MASSDEGPAGWADGFSRSAEAALGRFVREAEAAGLGNGLEFADQSPLEGEWSKALAVISPQRFITAKYEAWPELWSALAERGIGLTVVGARDRGSLRLAARVLRLLGGRLPQLQFLVFDSQELPALQSRFGASVQDYEVTGDPRWDRVMNRVQKGNARAAELIAVFRNQPRPWGILGQVWSPDLERWSATVDDLPLKAPGSGTVWIAPHVVDEESVAELETVARQWGLDAVRTSRVRGSGAGISTGFTAGPTAVIVDEMGILSELYSAADWAYVGGGFGPQVHSTLEPAVQAIPIACGPRGEDKFAEIDSLRGTGQLHVVRSAGELLAWRREHCLKIDAGAREIWRDDIERRSGAAERVLGAIIRSARPEL